MQWRSQEKLLDDSWKSNEKFMSKLKASHEPITSHEHEQVAESCYQDMNKSWTRKKKWWTSHEQNLWVMERE